MVKPFMRSFGPPDKSMIIRINVAGQKRSAVGVGAHDQQGVGARDIGGKPRGGEFGDELARGHQNFSAKMPAFFDRSELVFKMNARSAFLDHLFHDFKGMKRPSESGFGIGHKRREPVNAVVLF